WRRGRDTPTPPARAREIPSGSRADTAARGGCPGPRSISPAGRSSLPARSRDLRRPGPETLEIGSRAAI
ncbi:MAG: hypothetical protein AVDCRST_MAG41-2142, partial [uncultured Corynebacteriales bacterium]